jgi:hypothetical protein
MYTYVCVCVCVYSWAELQQQNFGSQHGPTDLVMLMVHAHASS